ncbi:MAG: hypothetical protein AB8U25_00405 [Rickettsiales endosymbiont of Dermacentor nuttalli]
MSKNKLDTNPLYQAFLERDYFKIEELLFSTNAQDLIYFIMMKMIGMLYI